MDDNLEVCTYLEESLANNINFLRAEDDNTDMLNKTLEISSHSLREESEKMGSLSNVLQSSSPKGCDLSVKNEILDSPLKEVEVKDKMKGNMPASEDTSLIETVAKEVKNESVEIKLKELIDQKIMLCDSYSEYHKMYSTDRKNPQGISALYVNIPKVNIITNEKSMRKGSEVGYNCKECGVSFHNISIFHQHMKTHSVEKPYKCKFCDRSFQKGHHLKIHQQVHSRPTSFKCEICSEIFKCKSSLNTHKKKHIGKKDHSCGKCPASFYSKYELKIHSLRHEEDLPYKCKVCGDQFAVASRLKRHLMVHTGERPFQCEICGVVFRERFTLTSHMGTHLLNGPYSCDICGEKFPRLNSLNLHKRVHYTDSTYSYVPKKCDQMESETINLKLKLSSQKLCKEGDFLTDEQTLHSTSNLPLSDSEIEKDVTVAKEVTSHLSDTVCKSEKRLESLTCDICGEKFLHLNTLISHKKIHKTTYSSLSKKLDLVESDATSVKCNPSTQKVCTDEVFNNEQLLQSISNLPSSEEVCYMNSDMEKNINVKEFPSDLSTSVFEARSLDKSSSEAAISVPHPDIVQEALSSGTLLETQSGDGKGYLIVLPKTLLEKNYTLFTVSAPPVPSKIHNYSDKTMKDIDGVTNNACNMFDYDNSLDSVTEVDFQQNQADNSEGNQNKLKRPKRQKGQISVENEDTISNIQPKRMEKLPVKKTVKKKKSLASRLYQCQQCGKNYKSSSNLNIHNRTHTGERPFYCDYCGLGFKQLTHLQSHIRLHTGEKPYQCNLCDQTFSQSSRLKYHIQNIHIKQNLRKGKIKSVKGDKASSVRNFYCKICDLTFLNSCFKSEHMKTHADETRYNCVKCDASFKGKSGLKKHQNCHADDKWCICELCGFQYKDLNTLNLHKKEMHSIVESPEVNGNLSSENSEQHNYKQTNCEYPDNIDTETPQNNKYNSGSIMDRSYEKLSEGDKESASDLKRLQDGRFQCCVCGKIFNYRSNAQVHARLHSDVRPYKCNDCGCAFRQISHLKDHAKMHTGEKPFKCSVCPAAFAQSSGVKVHIKKYHKGHAVVINEKNGLGYTKKNSISVEILPQPKDNTVIISIENGQLVSVERLHYAAENEHSEDTEQQCNLCDKNILNRYMKYHMRTHKKLTYKCVACKKFFTKCGFTPNAESRTEEPFAVCNKCSVDDVSSLLKLPEVNSVQQNKKTQALMNHKNNKLQKFNLEKNVNLVNWVNETKNICETCGKSFRRKSALKFHMNSSHGHDNSTF